MEHILLVILVVLLLFSMLGWFALHLISLLSPSPTLSSVARIIVVLGVAAVTLYVALQLIVSSQFLLR